jgi:hypothetical protein
LTIRSNGKYVGGEWFDGKLVGGIWSEQPHRAGYKGLFTEMTFDEAGGLYGIWEWE